MTQLPPSGAGVFATQFPEAWDAYQGLCQTNANKVEFVIPGCR
jgi:hypothetical protein